jgi:hypothetical protein
MLGLQAAVRETVSLCIQNPAVLDVKKPLLFLVCIVDKSF